VRILGIAGSLREGSYNAMLLRAAAELLPDGVELDTWPGLKAVPPFDEDDEDGPVPAPVAELRDAIAGADAVLIATPEYNGSVPGQLKNALDWASRPTATTVLRNKPVAVVGASVGGFGAVWAQADLRRILGRIGARVVEVELPVAHAHTRFDGSGRLVDDDLRSALGDLLEPLLESVHSRELAAA
jgi:chromate reductase, NAD(P)H dehydrogenase (quinone)